MSKQKEVIAEKVGTQIEVFVLIALPREFNELRKIPNSRLDVPHKNGNAKWFLTFDYLHSEGDKHFYGRKDSERVVVVKENYGFV